VRRAWPANGTPSDRAADIKAAHPDSWR